MKPPWLLLLTICAALIGYGVGAIFTGEGEPAAAAGGSAVPTNTGAAGAGPGASALRGDGPFASVFSALKTRGTLEDLAKIDDALAALELGRFPQLLAAITASSRVDRWEWLRLVLAHWFERDPEGAGQWVLAKAAHFKAFGDFGAAGHERAMIQLLAKYRPDEALALARQNAGRPLAGYLLEELAHTWPADRRAEALRTLASFPAGKDRELAVRELFDAWAKEAPREAMAAAQSMPAGAERNHMFFLTLRGLAQSDPQAAFALLNTIPDADLTLAGTAIIPGIRSPEFASDWLKGHPDTPAAIAERLVGEWAQAEPVAALEWARAHGLAVVQFANPFPSDETFAPTLDSNTIRGASRTVSPALVAALNTHPAEATAWMLQQPPGPERDAMIQMTLGRFAKPTVESARELFSQLSPEAQPQAAHMMIHSQYAKNPEAARAWMETLPAGPVREAAWNEYGQTFPKPADLAPGPERDAMLDGLANQNVFELEKAWGWIQQIQNPERRREAFDATMWTNLKETWAEPTDAKAREFLQNSKTVPAEWKQAWAGK